MNGLNSSSDTGEERINQMEVMWENQNCNTERYREIKYNREGKRHRGYNQDV